MTLNLINPYFTELAIAILSVLISIIIWYWFFKPYDLFVDVTENGFDSISSHKGSSNSFKKNLINELRQTRKVGDLPPAYPNGWYAILESDEVPIKGVKEASALGQNLVAWRGESGRCYVADAYCPHLGAHLGVGGTVVGKECIQCPFHSWTFNGSRGGEVENIIYSECLPPANLGRLKMWPVAEHLGFIYIWYHADGMEPSWTLPVVPEVEVGRWKYRGRTEFRVACHIQEIPENGADAAHLNVVHVAPALKHGMDLEKEWNIVKHVWEASWAARAEPGKEHEAVSTVNHALAFFNDSFRLFEVVVKARQIGPGIVYLEFDTAIGRAVMVQSVTPLEPLLQKVIHRLYTAPTIIHPIGRIILQTEAVQIARDIRIWNRKCFLKKPVLVKEDKFINKFRRWYSQFYSEGSAKISVKSCSNGNYTQINGEFKNHPNNRLIDF